MTMSEPMNAVFRVTLERTERRFDSYDVTLVLVLPGSVARTRNSGHVREWLVANIDTIACEIGEVVKSREDLNASLLPHFSFNHSGFPHDDARLLRRVAECEGAPTARQLDGIADRIAALLPPEKDA